MFLEYLIGACLLAAVAFVTFRFGPRDDDPYDGDWTGEPYDKDPADKRE
jgi:hypothetical protein